MRVAIMALQGAFAEHANMLRRIGAETFEVRQASDWQEHKDALILPGGESTVQARLLTELGLMQAIRDSIADGLPVLGTCAGLILLARQATDSHFARLETMNIRARRNAYGRQLGSFRTTASLEGVGDMEMTFIRAPYIEDAGDDVEVLARVDNHIVAARQGNQLVTAFHPELEDNTALHRFFLDMAAAAH